MAKMKLDELEKKVKDLGFTKGNIVEGPDGKLDIEGEDDEGEDMQTAAVREEEGDEALREGAGVGVGVPGLRERPGRVEGRGEEEGKSDGRGSSGRISEPDFETMGIAAAENFLARLIELYRKGAEIVDRRKSDDGRGRCTVCGEVFPEGKHRGEKVFAMPRDPNRFQVFRTCTDRCSIILDQNIHAYRSGDAVAMNRIKREYFVKRINKPGDK